MVTYKTKALMDLSKIGREDVDWFNWLRIDSSGGIL
jgi:hypothetical protein